jgi:hypothetical protein
MFLISRDYTNNILSEQYTKTIDQSSYLSSIQIRVPFFEYKENYLILDKLNPYSIVANVDLVEYAREINRFIPRIFDANVRNPLKNSINSNMSNTIIDSEERNYFWHYNNGLTILVEDIEIDNGFLILKAPTIVNGCQTTDTISKTIKKLGSKADEINIPLLIRFIKVKPKEMDESLRLSIARYTNQQAPVIAPDFKSNEDEQKIIADRFRKLSPMVFYERKRGEWRANKTEQNQYSRFVTMVDIGQRWYAFRVSPSKAIVNKGELFKDDGVYKMVFTPPKSAAEYYIAYLLFEKFEKYLKDQKQSAEGKSDPQSLLFLNLARAKNLVASHMTHLVGEMIANKHGELDNSSASYILKKVLSDRMVTMLLPHLVTVLKQYNMTLPKDQTWILAWKNEDAINALEDLLLQHIEVYNSTFEKNLLDLI